MHLKNGSDLRRNPNNPTGTYVKRDELGMFIAAVPPSTLVLIDEAYFVLADAPGYATAIDFIAQHPNVLVARTFSKIYGMAGMRLGYGIGSVGTIDLISRYLVQDKHQRRRDRRRKSEPP